MYKSGRRGRRCDFQDQVKCRVLICKGPFRESRRVSSKHMRSSTLPRHDVSNACPLPKGEVAARKATPELA